MLQIVHDQRRNDVDGCLPDHVVDEGLFREPIDEREQICEKHDLRDHECGHRRASHGGDLDPVLPQHQRSEQREDVKGDEEEDRRRNNLVHFLHDSLSDLAHVGVSLTDEMKRTGYWPSCARALRSGSLDTCIRPSNGWSSSRIMKMAPDTDSAQTNNVAITVAFGGAYSPKLTKRMAIQPTSITRNGMGIEPFRWAASNQRVAPGASASGGAWAGTR